MTPETHTVEGVTFILGDYEYCNGENEEGDAYCEYTYTYCGKEYEFWEWGECLSKDDALTSIKWNMQDRGLLAGKV